MSGLPVMQRSTGQRPWQRGATGEPANPRARGPCIWLVEQERGAAAPLVQRLTRAGYQVAIRQLGARAAVETLSEAFALLIIEIRRPGNDVHQLLRTLRERGVTRPVMLIAAHASAHDVARGLDSGADDYLTRPVAQAELMARVRVLLRRHPDACPFEVGTLALDLLQRTVTRNGAQVTLTAREFRLLHCLMRQSGKVVSREEIGREVWRSAERSPWLDNSIAVHVRRLRRKIDPDRRLIHAVRGFGYLIGDREA